MGSGEVGTSSEAVLPREVEVEARFPGSLGVEGAAAAGAGVRGKGAYCRPWVVDGEGTGDGRL